MTEVLPQGALEAAFPEYIEVTNDPLRQGGRSLLQLPGKKRILTSLLEPVSCGIGSCAYSGAFWFPARTILFFELLEETAADCRRNLFGCSKTLDHFCPLAIARSLGRSGKESEHFLQKYRFFYDRMCFRCDGFGSQPGTAGMSLAQSIKPEFCTKDIICGLRTRIRGRYLVWNQISTWDSFLSK